MCVWIFSACRRLLDYVHCCQGRAWRQKGYLHTSLSWDCRPGWILYKVPSPTTLICSPITSPQRKTRIKLGLREWHEIFRGTKESVENGIPVVKVPVIIDFLARRVLYGALTSVGSLCRTERHRALSGQSIGITYTIGPVFTATFLD